MEKTSAEKLFELRNLISQAGLDGLIVPHTDEYKNEYLPAHSKRLEFLTGFSGSAGYAIVLADKAVVASDGRYFPIQLAREVDKAAFDVADSTKITRADWIAANAKSGAKIGYDPKLHTPDDLAKLREDLGKNGIMLVPVPENMVDKVWGADRPTPQKFPVQIFPDHIDGRSSREKIAEISAHYARENIDHAVITLPDSIAWLLNVRGADVECNPYVLSTAILDVKAGVVEWFLDTDKIPSGDTALDTHLSGIKINSEKDLEGRLKTLGGRVALDDKKASVWFKEILGNSAVDLRDICIDIKAQKTAHQQDSIRKAHVEDAVALVKFFRWVEETAPSGALTEVGIAEKLEEFRGGSKAYQGPSFGAIVGAGENGAVVHYQATPETSRAVAVGDMILIDSGGQYLGDDFAGTTDITRTVVVGEPSLAMKHDYTRVLQAHIAVSKAGFDETTPGKVIDSYARDFLKSVGIDIPHGVGHGVGQYLSVHEEAGLISPREDRPFKSGFLLSNEPGCYREGQYGIRLENLVFVKRDQDGAMSFETITFVPFEPKLIDFNLLSDAELVWLKDYHAQMVTVLAGHPGLDADSLAWVLSKKDVFDNATRGGQPNLNMGREPSP